ncbi:hypothetical protein M413DRAFT_448360 [Hebeloma cylindrosporum]|uniref:Uncharacterized protein n=1 Tax=Hebeloma cylindrosporum TaxID=76867 RepID=A0A0C3BZS9_HEBCY|nr:hypothetical protein M413DRAFT_448360 [Hebeloma cylindrosporum h7]
MPSIYTHASLSPHFPALSGGESMVQGGEFDPPNGVLVNVFGLDHSIIEDEAKVGRSPSIWASFLPSSHC